MHTHDGIIDEKQIRKRVKKKNGEVNDAVRGQQFTYVSYDLSIFLLFSYAPCICISFSGVVVYFHDLHVFLLLFLQALVDSIENSSPKVSCFTAVLCEICLEYT